MRSKPPRNPSALNISTTKPPVPASASHASSNCFAALESDSDNEAFDHETGKSNAPSYTMVIPCNSQFKSKALSALYTRTPSPTRTSLPPPLVPVPLALAMAPSTLNPVIGLATALSALYKTVIGHASASASLVTNGPTTLPIPTPLRTPVPLTTCGQTTPPSPPTNHTTTITLP